MLTIRVEDLRTAFPVLVAIINDKRVVPQKGAYRMARLYQKLLPEYQTITAKHDEIVVASGAVEVPVNAADPDGPKNMQVPPDKMAEWAAAWKLVGDEVIIIDAEALPIEQLSLGDFVPGGITASEIVGLGALVAE